MNDDRRFAYPGGLSPFYLKALEELANQKHQSVEHLMFLFFLSGLERTQRRLAREAKATAGGIEHGRN